jgi:hypothetical protein
MSYAMGASDSELMTYVVRMVTPLKREFGRSVDVHQFLHDVPYAKEIIALAMSSTDLRLNSYAEYLETKMFGPRNTLGTPSADAKVAIAAHAAKPAANHAAPDTEASKAAAMEKYKTRLR